MTRPHTGKLQLFFVTRSRLLALAWRPQSFHCPRHWYAPGPMKRQAYLMKLKAGNESEYKRRHDEIWPELKQALTDAGVSDFSIFLDKETGTLFAIRKVADDSALIALPALPIVRKWWDYMAELMDTNPDNSPLEIPLTEMFHME